MSGLGLVLGATFAASGALCAALSVPLVRGRVAPNPWYGVRTRKAYASDDNWYALNRHGGRALFSYGVGLVAIGIVTLFLPLGESSAVLLFVGLAPLWLLVPTLVTIVRFARTLPDGEA